MNSPAHPALQSGSAALGLALDRSGEKSLYTDGAYAIGIEGMADEEARPILDFLANYIVQDHDPAYRVAAKGIADSFAAAGGAPAAARLLEGLAERPLDRPLERSTV